jgi:hypothetical protein
VVINNEERKRISLSKTAMENLSKIIKEHGHSNQHNSLSSSAVWVQRKGDKRENDDTVDSKKDEWISD